MDNQQEVTTTEVLTDRQSTTLSEALGDKSSLTVQELLRKVDERLIDLMSQLGDNIKNELKAYTGTRKDDEAKLISVVSKVVREVESNLMERMDGGTSVNKKVDELTARIGKWCVLPCASPSFLLLTRDDLGTSPCIQNEPARVKAAENVVKLEA